MKIYGTSKVIHAPMWRALRSQGVPIISTWIDEAGNGQTTDWDDLWYRCLAEATSCDVVILYAEPGDILRGALIEVGAALTHGGKIYYVGPVECVGSLLKSNLVIRKESINDVLTVLGV